MKIGDLVKTKYKIDVKRPNFYDKQIRMGIILPPVQRVTKKENEVFIVQWIDDYLPKKSLMISTELEIVSES